MVRLIPFIMLLSLLNAKEPFEMHCLECHNKLSLSFEKFYMQYLVKFSSNETIKEAMLYYLRDPKQEQSVMQPHVLKELGLMPKLQLDDSTLKEMIDIYVKKYDLRKRLHL